MYPIKKKKKTIHVHLFGDNINMINNRALNLFFLFGTL